MDERAVFGAAATLAEAPGLRILAITVEAPSEVMELNLRARIHRLVALFLETNWSGAGRTCTALKTLTFSLIDVEPSPTFSAEVDSLSRRLRRHLFGEASMIDKARVEVHIYAATRSIRTQSDARRLRSLHPAGSVTTPDAQPRSDGPHQHARPPKARSPSGANLRRRRRSGLSGRIGYQGVLSTAHNLIVFNEIAFRHPVRERDVLHPGPIGRSFSPPQELELIQEAAARAAEASMPEKPTLVLCPVSFATLSEPRTRGLLRSALSTLTSQHGPVLAVRVMATPDDVGPDLISTITAELAAHTRFVDWSTTSARMDLTALVAAKVQIYSLCLPPSEPERGRALSAFLALQTQARVHRLRTSIFGLKTDSELRQALASGVSYLSGPGVAALLDTPASPHPMSARWPAML